MGLLLYNGLVVKVNFNHLTLCDMGKSDYYTLNRQYLLSNIAECFQYLSKVFDAHCDFKVAGTRTIRAHV